MTERRKILRGLGVLGFATAFPGLTSRTLAAVADVQVLDNGITVLGSLGTNVLVFDGSDGLVLVDSGSRAEPGLLGSALAAATGRKTASMVFNTHYHAAQNMGNAEMRESGARIIAHRRTLEWMSTPTWNPRLLQYNAPRDTRELPTETFRDGGSLTSGGEEINYGYLIEAHTSSDIWVKFRRANVLAVGDVLSPVADPSFDWYTGAWIGGRVDALDQLLAVSDENTVIVPGYGPLLTRDHLLAEREMMAFIYERSVDLVRQGFGPRDMLDDGFMNGLFRNFDAPYEFLYDLCKGLWAHHNKLNHNVV